jgi:endogenous inhibitor of DNA gyrase (YacG/DUF329 family)
VAACPICRKPVLPRARNAAFPFCSSRCKLVDLAKWLGEEYRVPGPRAGDGAEAPQARDEDADA